MRNNICVFCGASEGVNPAYAEQARQLGQLLAAQGRRLIYGGGKKGLMGIVADAVLAAGGEAVGIIPERLVEAETAHRGLTELEVVPDMHTRKARMAALADSFIALPGGIGTPIGLLVGTYLAEYSKSSPLANAVRFVSDTTVVRRWSEAK